MDLSPIGRAALEAREGCRLTAYKDSVGVWTIGYGHTTAAGTLAVTPGLTITQAQANALLVTDLPKYVAPVAKAVKVPLADHQADALISLCFNIGPAAFARSTVARRLNAGDVAAAAEAILMWDRPAAIISRRQAEYDQFRTPYATTLPRARRGDRAPVKPSAAGFDHAASEKLTEAPAPSKTVTPAAAPARKPLDGPTGAPPPAPGFWSLLLSTIRTNMMKGA